MIFKNLLKSDGRRIVNKLAVKRIIQDMAESMGREFVMTELYREFRNPPIVLTKENKIIFI
ncbi:MAG TPA: hypothetical protein VJJ53_03155 [Candidatus Nanoarchaeia archaeon]|nr:hypothetical protein [Candidatus Nanoarchaeia archaeon]